MTGNNQLMTCESHRRYCAGRVVNKATKKRAKALKKRERYVLWGKKTQESIQEEHVREKEDSFMSAVLSP